jgi:hypothetical protein
MTRTANLTRRLPPSAGRRHAFTGPVRACELSQVSLEVGPSRDPGPAYASGRWCDWPRAGGPVGPDRGCSHDVRQLLRRRTAHRLLQHGDHDPGAGGRDRDRRRAHEPRARAHRGIRARNRLDRPGASRARRRQARRADAGLATAFARTRPLRACPPAFRFERAACEARRHSPRGGERLRPPGNRSGRPQVEQDPTNAAPSADGSGPPCPP